MGHPFTVDAPSGDLTAAAARRIVAGSLRLRETCMLRQLSAVALFALAGAALACDDGARGKSASYAPDDGVPEKAAEVRTTTPTKDTVAAPAPSNVVKKPQAEPKRKPLGKPLNS